MKLLWHVHGWPTVHSAGAERMAESISTWLIQKGHEVDVLTDWAMLGGPTSGLRNGCQIWCVVSQEKEAELFSACDVVLTHLDLSRRAGMMAKRHGKPLVHLVHNPWTLEYWSVPPSEVDLLVFNSRWLFLQTWPTRPAPSLIVYPPVWPEEYGPPRTERLPIPKRRISMLNLSENKGVSLFWELARRMPERTFMGVRGCYDEQVHSALPNAEVLAHSPRVRELVYQRTDLLLVPSRFETWGRVAVEAMASGVPVLASPTEGLTEAMQGAGVLLPPTDPEAWELAIRRLDDDALWSARNRAGCARADELAKASHLQLEALESALLRLSRGKSPGLVVLGAEGMHSLGDADRGNVAWASVKDVQEASGLAETLPVCGAWQGAPTGWNAATFAGRLGPSRLVPVGLDQGLAQTSGLLGSPRECGTRAAKELTHRAPSMIKLQALRSFRTRQEGTIAKGQVFEAQASRRRELIQRGLAEEL